MGERLKGASKEDMVKGIASTERPVLMYSIVVASLAISAASGNLSLSASYLVCSAYVGHGTLKVVQKAWRVCFVGVIKPELRYQGVQQALNSLKGIDHWVAAGEVLRSLCVKYMYRQPYHIILCY